MNPMSKGLLSGILLSCLLISTVDAAPRETVNLDGAWSNSACST